MSCWSPYCGLGHVIAQAAEGRVSSYSCRLAHLADNAEKYIFIKLCRYEDSNEHFHVGDFSGGPVRCFVLAPVSFIFICHL